MRINLYILQIWVLFFLILGCSSKSSLKDQELSNTILLKEERDTVKGLVKYAPSDTVVIIEKVLITDTTDQEFYTPCLDWKLTEAQIKKVLALSDTIDGHEFHYLYYYLPCEIEGKLRVQGKEYNFTLNSGSFIHLAGPDTSFYMGCANQECEQYFLEKGGEFSEEFE